MSNNKSQIKSVSKQELADFHEKIVEINRTSKKTKGGNRLSFSALVVAGDKNGRVGAGLGKAREVASAIQKATRRAKKALQEVPLVGESKTIPFRIEVKLKAVKVLLKPAPAGTGIRAGGPVRAVLEAAGYQNVVSKILGSDNKKGNVYAALEALKKLQRSINK